MENFNIQSETNWKKGQKNLITVYKLIELDLSFAEFQNEVNKFIFILFICVFLFLLWFFFY